MSEQTFKVVFKGKIDKTVGLERAKANFAKLFKLPESKVELMFDGKERTLKKEMPMDKASHFRSVLKKAGIKVSLIKNEAIQVEQTMEDWVLNDPGTVILRPVKAPERHIETSHIKVDVDFDQLENKPQADPPEVDIDHIVIDDSEEPIIQTKEVEMPNFDFSGLDLDEVGSIMVHQKKIETPDIPIDGLEFNDSDEAIVKKVHIEEPEIDISNISLDIK